MIVDIVVWNREFEVKALVLNLFGYGNLRARFLIRTQIFLLLEIKKILILKMSCVLKC